MISGPSIHSHPLRDSVERSRESLPLLFSSPVHSLFPTSHRALTGGSCDAEKTRSSFNSICNQLTLVRWMNTLHCYLASFSSSSSSRGAHCTLSDQRTLDVSTIVTLHEALKKHLFTGRQEMNAAHELDMKRQVARRLQ